MERRKSTNLALALRQLKGAPTKYMPEYNDVVLKFRMLGISDKQIAECIGVNPTTLYDWVKRHSKFAQAWREGGAAADARVAHSLYRRAMGWEHKATRFQYNPKIDKWAKIDYIERYPGEVQAQSLWLANKQPGLWKSARSVTENLGEQNQLPPIIVVEGVWGHAPTIEGRAE